eukprot:15471804-Alexandrium_andersonii.AAC.1
MPLSWLVLNSLLLPFRNAIEHPHGLLIPAPWPNPPCSPSWSVWHVFPACTNPSPHPCTTL